jgi:hypothetical protein
MNKIEAEGVQLLIQEWKLGTSDRTQPKYLNNRIRLQQNRKRGVQAPQPGEDEPPEQTQPMYKHEFFREQQNRG